MTFYRLIGSISIIFSAVATYIEMQKYEKIKLKQINSFIIFIEHIKSQIECFLLPIDRIIHACDENLIRNCGIETDYRGINTLEDLFDNAAIYCGDECIETLMTFSKSFGQGYADEQLRSCSYCILELIKIRDKMKEKGIKERKVKLALCLSVSLSLILLLI